MMKLQVSGCFHTHDGKTTASIEIGKDRRSTSVVRRDDRVICRGSVFRLCQNDGSCCVQGRHQECIYLLSVAI